MTSFMISQFIDRINPYILDEECTFCKIIQRKEAAHIVYEDDHLMAFLDVLPIRPGHTLLVPKAHHARITDLPPKLSSALGVGLARIGDALTKSMNNPDINFVCNQGYAQAVHHVHFHLVPAPVFNASSIFSRPITNQQPVPHSTVPPSSDVIRIMERENRDELDDYDAEKIAERIRSKLETRSGL